MMAIFLQGYVKIKEKLRHVKIVEACSASCLINSLSFIDGRKTYRKTKLWPLGFIPWLLFLDHFAVNLYLDSLVSLSTTKKYLVEQLDG